MPLIREVLTGARRIVVKVGTSVLTEPGGDQLSPSRVHAIAEQVAKVHRAGREVIVVSSGAIAAGMQILGYRHRPTALPRLQAASSVGQGRLIHLYESAFAEQGFHAAQLLLTRDDLQGPRRRNVRATLTTLLAAGTIPIINENDSVAVDEIRVGDNDQLSAHVAVLAGAQLLILLSDVNGLRQKKDDPTTLIHWAPGISPSLRRLADESDKATSTGGMRTKLLAAQIAVSANIVTIITDGRQPQALTDVVLDGQQRGTAFAHFPAPRSAERASHG